MSIPVLFSNTKKYCYHKNLIFSFEYLTKTFHLGDFEFILDILFVRYGSTHMCVNKFKTSKKNGYNVIFSFMFGLYVNVYLPYLFFNFN